MRDARRGRLGLGPDISDAVVRRLDPATGKTTAIEVGAQPQKIAPAAGALWVADSGQQEITRIDARTGKTTSIPCEGYPAWTAYDGDTVWIGDQTNGEIVELDARTAKIVRRSQAGATPNDGDVSATRCGSRTRRTGCTGSTSRPIA